MPDDPGASLPEPELKPEPEPEPEPAEGAPDFGSGLPDEVLRQLLLACAAAEGQAPGLVLARCAAVHPVWRQVARRTPGCVLAAFGATGSIVEWVVPDLEGLESVGIEACGAQGGGSAGSGGYGPQMGGRGARVVCRAAVRPGERLAVPPNVRVMARLASSSSSS